MSLSVIADTRAASNCEGTIKRRRGPQSKPIDLTELEKLCAIHATIMEIASWFGCGHATIERRIADETLHDHDGGKLTFRQIMDRGYARGRISLRRKQMQLAEQGNATMLVWLGKQLLGQRDHVDQTIDTPDGSGLRIEIVRVAWNPDEARVERPELPPALSAVSEPIAETAGEPRALNFPSQSITAARAARFRNRSGRGGQHIREMRDRQAKTAR